MRRSAGRCDDADKAERLLRNLARRLDQEAPGVATSILEGLDEMLTVNRLKLPAKLRRSLACTNSIENMMGTVRRVCRNVKRWRNTAMALRWTAAGMMEAARGFRRLKAYRLLPILRAALVAHATEHVATKELNRKPMPHSISHSDACPRLFNKKWGIPGLPGPRTPPPRGGAGPTAFYSNAVGAVLIEGSEPGVYRGLLRSSGSEF